MWKLLGFRLTGLLLAAHGAGLGAVAGIRSHVCSGAVLRQLRFDLLTADEHSDHWAILTAYCRGHPRHVSDEPDDFPPEPVEIPIDGVLDLHLFSPKEVKPLLQEYLSACQEKGILQVRIIHGKGTGALRRSVESIVSKNPIVLRSWTASESDGGWGATWVALSASGQP